MRLPLFWKILLVTLPPLLAFAALGLSMNYLSHRRAKRVARQAYYLAQKESEAELGRRLIAIARATAALTRSEDVRLLQPGDEKSRTYRRLQQMLSRVAARTGSRRLYLFDRQRSSLCDTAAGVTIGARYYHLSVDRHLVKRVFENRSSTSMLFTGKDGTPYKTGFAAIMDEQGTVVAALAVEGSADTFADLRRLQQQLSQLNRDLLPPLLIGLIVFIVLLLLAGASLLITRSVTRPVHALVEAAGAIGRGDLEQPVEQHSQDELGVLAASMDRMRRDLLARQKEMQLMLSGIAHEVRNPLGGMELFVGLLRDEVGEDPDRAEMVSRIQRELEYLNRVVNEFLDYARHTTLQLGEVRLRNLLSELAELLQGDARKKGLELGLGTVADVVVEADVEKLRRALLNIVRNAVQVTPEGGSVTLEARLQQSGTLTATFSGARREAVITCTDTGPGIEAAEVDKIFNAFYTTRERGTGLGLALAQKIVNAHGGQLEVDSTPGQGCQFRIVLPHSTPKPPQT